jgi:hypothetical protein
LLTSRFCNIASFTTAIPATNPPDPPHFNFCGAVTNHTRHALRLRAELEHISSSSSSDGSSVHSMPFDLPCPFFTVDALSTALLPVVFLPLQAVTSEARLLLRTSGAPLVQYDSHDDESNDDACIAVKVSGRGCQGLLSITRHCDAARKSEEADSSGSSKLICVKNRVGLPLPFVVAQSGSCTVAPCNGFIPAYGSVTLVAGGGGARARGCGASICVVRELLQQSFKSTLLV